MSYRRLHNALNHMLQELRNSRLTVELIPAPEPQYSGHMIRAVVSTNPEWYQELCSRYKAHRSTRKGKYKKHGDTRVKRRHIINILAALANGRAVNSKYTDFLLYQAEEIEKQFETLAEELAEYEPVPF